MSAAPPGSFATFDVSKSDRNDALTVVGLSVTYRIRGRDREVLQDVSFRVRRGEAYGLVGESGCGKSTVAMTTLRYLPRNGKVKAGKILIAGDDVQKLGADALRRMRATTISMVYQDPARALNPSLTIARQVSEAFEAAGVARDEALQRTLEMLKRVRIAAPERVMDSYPHQLSGGMQQRVVIAMALASNPALLILDEPTTGLDATVEAEVLDLIAQLREELGTAVLFISHNLAVIGRMCERVGVLYAGKLVEEGATRDVFARPRHPYTVGLLRCLPTAGRSKDTERLDTIAGGLPLPGSVTQGCIYAERCRLADDRCRRDAPPPYRLSAAHGDQMARCHYHERAIELPRATPAELPAITTAFATSNGSREFQGSAPVLRARNLSKTFHASGAPLRAVDDVSLELAAGETLGLVGESGSGKTTLARLMLGLLTPDAGSVLELDGAPLAARVTRRSDEQLKSMQIVFQNPDSALNRAHSVRRLIGRALARFTALRGDAADARLAALSDAVRLPERYLDARSRQLSGGLKQRVAIARAFAGEPRVVVCDEPTSSLDVSVQAAILNLLADLQRERGVSYVFISHDLHVVRYVSDRIAVLYLGRLLEIGPATAVFDGPRHPYTEALLSAVPTLNGHGLLDGPHGEQSEDNELSERRPATRTRIRLEGEPPGTGAMPSGCVFHARCPRKLGAICEQQDPPFLDAGSEPGERHAHRIRCHIPVATLRELQSASRDIDADSSPDDTASGDASHQAR